MTRSTTILLLLLAVALVAQQNTMLPKNLSLKEARKLHFKPIRPSRSQRPESEQPPLDCRKRNRITTPGSIPSQAATHAGSRAGQRRKPQTRTTQPIMQDSNSLGQYLTEWRANTTTSPSNSVSISPSTTTRTHKGRSYLPSPRHTSTRSWNSRTSESHRKTTSTTWTSRIPHNGNSTMGTEQGRTSSTSDIRAKDAEANLLEAELALKTSHYALAELLGRTHNDIPEGFHLNTAQDYTQTPEVSSVEENLQYALENRPDLIAQTERSSNRKPWWMSTTPKTAGTRILRRLRIHKKIKTQIFRQGRQSRLRHPAPMERLQRKCNKGKSRTGMGGR
jgi:hypothetical protein